MDNLNKLKRIFADCVGIDVKDVTLALSRNDVATWDSFSTVTLINEIEESFQVSLDLDVIIGFRTFGNIVDTLKVKGVSLE